MTLFGWIFRSRGRRPVSWPWRQKQQDQPPDDTKNEDLLFQCVQTALSTPPQPPPPPQKRWSTGMILADIIDLDYDEHEQQQPQPQQQRARRRRRRSSRIQSIPPTCGYHLLSAIPEVVDKHSSLSPLPSLEMETRL